MHPGKLLPIICLLMVCVVASFHFMHAAEADELYAPSLRQETPQQLGPSASQDVSNPSPYGIVQPSPERSAAAPAIRSQQKKIVQPGKPIHIAVIGAISRPGVYRFENGNPQLNDVVQMSGPLTADHSGAIRIIRDERPGLQTYHSPKNRIPLLDGDVLLIEERSATSHVTSAVRTLDARSMSDSSTAAIQNPFIQSAPSASVSGAKGSTTKNLYIACVNLIDRPVVINLNKKIATVPALLRHLGQSPELAPTVRLIQAQRRTEQQRSEQTAANNAVQNFAPVLPEQTDNELLLTAGTVLVFDRGQIDASRVPPLPAVISTAQTDGAMTVPVAPLAPAVNRDRRTGPQFISPQEPAPFPNEPAAPVPSLPYVESNTPKSADAGSQVEKVPAPPSLTGPDFGASYPEGESGQQTPPRNDHRRLTQGFGSALPFPANDTPYHDSGTEHQRGMNGATSELSGASDFESQSTATRSPLQRGPIRKTNRANNNLLMFLTGATIALLCIGSIILNKYRVTSKMQNASAAQVETTAAQTTSSASLTPAASLLPAILDPRYPVVNESFPLGGKLQLSGLLDTARMLRIDQTHSMRRPITQTQEFSVGQKADSLAARDSVSAIPSDPAFTPKNGAVRIDRAAEDQSNVQNSRETIDSRLARFTNHEKRRSHVRATTRMLRTDLGHVTADAAATDAGTDAIGNRQTAATNRHRAEQRTEKEPSAGGVEHRPGLLDRALSLLQRERTT